MVSIVKRLINNSWSQNYIIKNPATGSLIVGFFWFAFAILYRPLGSHAGYFLNYEATMAMYALIGAVAVYVTVKILRQLRFFAPDSEWTLLKEIAGIILVLFGAGIAVYFAAFILEEPADRWNLTTFVDSVFKSFLVGVIPFAFNTIMNARFQGGKEVYSIDNEQENEISESIIHINSQLKKEELSFTTSEFIYAESEGNYVVFYLLRNSLVKREIIRNSMSNIEEQLLISPQFLRVHRAFIVNLSKVLEKKGNSLGYRLRLFGIDKEIPVSRNNTSEFVSKIKQIRQ